MRATLLRPHRVISQVPSAVLEARVWIVAKDDGGLDVRAEGDCKDEASARAVTETLRQVVASMDTFLVRMITHDLPSSIKVEQDGAKVRISADASAVQVQATLGIIAASFGESLDPPK